MVIGFYFLIIFILLYSIILHELAHAFVSVSLGDDTPKIYGRLTLNPIPHLDFLGTIFPILLFLSGSPVVFGWAKPVPINPYNYRDYKKGILLVSSAGVLTNFFIAWLFSIVYRFFPFSTDFISIYIYTILEFSIRINVVLAVFNLLPIPPLDGSKILFSLVSSKYSEFFYQLEQYGFLILIFLLLFPPTSYFISFLINLIFRFLTSRVF